MTQLEEAVSKYHIPAWPYEASYDRVVVFSLPEDKATRDTFIAGGKVFMPEAKKEYEKNTTPRGVIVSAGLSAMDYLYSHGMGLGHVVWVARLSPWRHEVDRDKDGREISFLFLRAGDLCGSEELLRQRREGKVTVTRKPDGTHHYVFADDVVLPRFDPPSYVA